MWGQTKPAIPPKPAEDEHEYLLVTFKTKETVCYRLNTALDVNFGMWKRQFLTIDREDGDRVFLNLDSIEGMVNTTRKEEP